MSLVGRNAPCPCGSGKKFKKCCLRKEQGAAVARQLEEEAVGTALAWLADRYPEEVKKAVQYGFYSSLEEGQKHRLGELPGVFVEMLEINIGEWLVTDGEIETEDGPRIARELLFESGGPLLPVAGRAWLEEVARRPLGLFEVQRVTPGEGLEVKDLLEDAAEPVWVVERSASRSLVQWETFGARLARRAGRWVFTGAMFPLPREDAEACRQAFREEQKGEDRNTGYNRDLVHDTICSQWLDILVGEPVSPEVLDVSTGEPMVLTTIHYRVRDWGRLEEILDAEPEVTGDREEGWVCFEDTEDSMRRSRAVLNPRGPDRMEVFCRTVALADAARGWLDEIAGDALEHLTREVVDPTSPKALEAARERPPERLPSALEAEVRRDALRTHYANWTDEPIPALNGRTPRECLDTDEGREAVVVLLESYEQSETRRAREQRTEPFDFGFLWERLGLAPDALSSS